MVCGVQVDAKVLLGDRRLHITLARVWASLSSWQKVKLVWMFIHSGLTLSKLKEDLAEEIESTKVGGVCINVHALLVLQSATVTSLQVMLYGVDQASCSRLPAWARYVPAVMTLSAPQGLQLIGIDSGARRGNNIACAATGRGNIAMPSANGTSPVPPSSAAACLCLCCPCPLFQP